MSPWNQLWAMGKVNMSVRIRSIILGIGAISQGNVKYAKENESDMKDEEPFEK